MDYCIKRVIEGGLFCKKNEYELFLRAAKMCNKNNDSDGAIRYFLSAYEYEKNGNVKRRESKKYLSRYRVKEN